ncbi:MAG TPA: hypothetical protein VK816_07815, partial [Jatrophihabitantaceae bacterium]|nr:hypothetical protein [Jatrophihabitantaceae bacterium]
MGAYRLVIAFVVVGLFSLGVEVRSAWMSSDATTATITITGGALSMSVPAVAGNLGSQPDAVGGEAISGPLG